MKSEILISCDACGIATYDWDRLLLQVAGRTVLDLNVCRRCASNVQDTAKRTVREAA